MLTNRWNSAVGTADLEPAHRDRAPAADRIVDGIDNRLGLLLALDEFAVAPLDQFGGPTENNSRAVLPDDLARDMPIIVSAALLTKT